MGSFEAAHYEVDGLWTEEQFGENEIRRMERTIELIPHAVTSLLDVGCGNGLFIRTVADLRPDITRVHGLDRSQAALRRVTSEKTRSSIEALPFADESFDIVCCLEVLEHLPSRVFQCAIAEIARVARRNVLVSVPFEEDLEANLIQCRSCMSRFSPYLHLRSFSREDMTSIFSAHGCNAKHVVGLGESRLLYGWTAFRRRYAPGKAGRNPYPYPLPCPICGEMMPGRIDATTAARSPERGAAPMFQNLRQAIKRAWPTYSKPTRIAAVYEKTMTGQADDFHGPPR